MALTSAMALRASSRSRGAAGGSIGRATTAADSSDADDDAVPLDDLAAGLRRLGAYAVTALTLLATAWIWELDMALVRFLLNQPLWSLDGQTPVTVGDVTEAAARDPAGSAGLAVHEHSVRRDDLSHGCPTIPASGSPSSRSAATPSWG